MAEKNELKRFRDRIKPMTVANDCYAGDCAPVANRVEVRVPVENSVTGRDVRRQAEFWLGTDSACRMWHSPLVTSDTSPQKAAATCLKGSAMRFSDRGTDKPVSIDALEPTRHGLSDTGSSVQHYMAEVDGVLIGVVVSYGTRGISFYRVNPDTGALTLIPAEFDE